jgi:hypothetical protein
MALAGRDGMDRSGGRRRPYRGWIADARRALARWSAGQSYLNFIPDVDPERLEASYAPMVWQRLRAVRADWDPDGVFGAGHAIPL